jgi:putative membrane protein
MKTILLAAIAFTLASCTTRNVEEDTRYDTNAAEASETPGEKVRGNSDTNEEAERKAKALHVAIDPVREAKEVKQADSSDFVTKAAEAGLTEVGLGQLAARKARNKKVVEFAERMVKDHSAANDELKALASEKGIHVPVDCIPCQSKFKEFANVGMTGLDEQYAKLMVEDHQAAVKLFEKESTDGKDPDIKKWAGEKLPVLKHHLAMAQELNDELAKSKTAQGSKTNAAKDSKSSKASKGTKSKRSKSKG